MKRRRHDHDCMDIEREERSEREGPPPFDDPQYRKHLEGMGLNEEQTVSVLQSLDLIAQTFVDLAWSVDPTQLALGKTAKEFWEADKPELSPELERLIEELIASEGKKSE